VFDETQATVTPTYQKRFGNATIPMFATQTKIQDTFTGVYIGGSINGNLALLKIDQVTGMPQYAKTLSSPLGLSTSKGIYNIKLNQVTSTNLQILACA
jgi:hypothetical protein